MSACDNTEKDQLDVDKDKNGAVTEVADEDPIATDCFISENIEEADEELCIVPDSERVISQVFILFDCIVYFICFDCIL